MTLLQIYYGEASTTINTLVNYSRCPLTHIAVQVIYTSVKSYLSPHKHNYLIYYLWTFLRILGFGYPASNIVINSSQSSRALIVFLTPLSSQSLTINGLPITILDSSIVTTKNTTNGYINAFSLPTLVHVHATDIM